MRTWIASMTEDGFRLDVVEDFAAWVRERTEGVKPEYHPKFLAALPSEWLRGEGGSQNEYVVIRGDVVVPRAVTTVTEYVLPEAK